MARLHSHGSRRLAKWTAVVVLAIIAGWTWALVWFAENIPRQVANLSSPTDAVVVLTGGSDRLRAGFELLAQKRARKLFVSGVYHGVDVAELLRMSRQAPKELECCVTLGYTADDTEGNAHETAQWMAKENFRSLRLVTANYHMQRSLLEFRRAMPAITVIPHPVFPKNFKGEGWWLWPGTTSLILREHFKYVVALAWGLVASGKGAAKSGGRR